MPRKTPVPEREKEIGNRLREARERLLISKTTFAEGSGMTRERLFNYETGRTPLPWDVGEAICHDFNVNPLWLATGEGLPFLSHGWGDEDVGRRPRSFLFSEGVALFSAGMKRFLRECQESYPRPDPERGRLDDELGAFGREIIAEWMKSLPMRNRRRFLAALRKAGNELIARYKQ